jgi:hypothetical protein
VVGKYTYYGDVNFSSAVDDGDYAVLDANYGSAPAPGIAMLLGDANFSGSVDSRDYAILNANYGSQLAAAAGVTQSMILAPPWAFAGDPAPGLDQKDADDLLG